MINQFLKLPVLLLVLILLPVHVRSQDNFFAYHTKLSHTYLPVKPIMSRDGKHLRGFT
jgi:hypothetical protein